MKQNCTNKIVYVILVLIYFTAGPVIAQTPSRLGPASDDEIKKALIFVEANLDSLNAHRAYIYAKGMNNPDLIIQYGKWIKKYPKNVNIPLAIGTVFSNASMAQPKDFLLQAAALDPKNAEIWCMLAVDANMRSQNDLANEYFGKATLIDPSNARYAYGYLKTFENGAPDAYKRRVFDFVKCFPADEFGAQALYWLGERASDPNDKIHYLEVLRELYPLQKFNWSASGTIQLIDAYLQTDPQKALLLINELSNDTDWVNRKEVAESLIKIHQLEQDQNYKDALIRLDQIKLSNFNYGNDFITLKRAYLLEKAGNVAGAYDSLSVKFAKQPTDVLFGALESYGKKMGKNKEEVNKDIDMIRYGKAVAAYPFELGLYTSKGKLSLDALKGQVILLTFWFPGCGPCREEFPHFQTVVDSFKNDSLVYIGINVLPSQDGYVLPYMKNTRYSFIPLRGSESFARQNYGVYGEPKNFVIDRDGKIIFQDFRIDKTNHRTLELMISSLLERGSAKQ